MTSRGGTSPARTTPPGNHVGADQPGSARGRGDRHVFAFPVEKLTALGRELGASMGEDLSAWTVFLREYSSLSEDDKAQVLALRRAYLDHWRAVLTEGMTSGAFREVDLSVVESVFGLFVYTFVWDDKGATGTQLTDAVMDLLLYGVRAAALPVDAGLAAGQAANGRPGAPDSLTGLPSCCPTRPSRSRRSGPHRTTPCRPSDSPRGAVSRRLGHQHIRSLTAPP